MPFDPFGWLARFLPERHLHAVIRLGGAALFFAFLLLRASQYADFRLKPLWAVETALYLALALAYAVRLPPVNRSSGLRDVALPLAAAVLPFALLASPPHPAVYGRPVLLSAVLWWMTAATALTVWGLWSLRRAFSITVEARALVTLGPYRWVRHPVYLGEILAAAAVAAWRFSAPNLALFAAFTALQLGRARWEEEKLGRCFPEYAAYARRSWWFR